MKILQINASYKPAYIYGGPTMSVSMLTEQLVKAGVAADVFTTTANGKSELTVKTGEPVIVEGVNVTYFNRLTKDHTHFSPSLLRHMHKNVKNYDAVHIHAWWNLASVLSCLIAVRRRVPVILSPRGTLSSYSFSNKNNRIKGIIHSWLGKWLLSKCFIHTTSDNEYDAIKSSFKSKAVFNIPNFIKLAEKNARYDEVEPADRLRLIFLSRIEEKKGLDILIDALQKVTVPYTLTIAGDGNPAYINYLQNLASSNNLVENVNWIGFQGENKFELLHRHDALVLPSHDENFGNVVIESLSVGTAVLISENVGLAGYVIQNDLGWICQTNSSSVSEKINAIYAEKSKLKQIKGFAPAKISADFNEGRLVKRYMEMYEQVLKTELA